MFLLLVCSTLQVVLTQANNGQTSLHQRKEADLKEFISIKPLVSTNLSYMDREQNLLSVPKFNVDDQKPKKKMTKKSAKRTIQKIIKKSKVHKKNCQHLHTSAPTKPPIYADPMENLYAKEDETQKKENLTTIHVREKKKRKWENRVPRYPMPFHKLKSMKDHRRNRRSDDREDLFVLTDLDEIEFLNNDDNNNTDIVNAHVKKYW